MKRTLFIVLAMLILITPLWAEEEQKGPEDTRLDQKVTYQAKEQFMYQIVADLSAKTGVYMDCGTSSKDWQVRERKMTIFVKDMPLKDLQKAIADLMNFTWARGAKDGVYIYRLFQDLRSKKNEESMIVQAEEAKAKERYEKRISALDELDKLREMTPDEIEKLRAKSPIKYILAKFGISTAMSDMIRTIPQLRSALVEEQGIVEIDLSTLPPTAMQSTRAFLNGYNNIEIMMTPPGQYVEILSSDDISSGHITISSMSEDEYNYDPMDQGMLGIMEVADSDGNILAMMPLMDFDDPVINMIGKMLLAVLDGAPPDSVEQNMEDEIMTMLIDTAKDEIECDPDDPDLEKTIKLPLDEMQGLPDLLEQLAQKTDLQYISDCFNTSTDVGLMIMLGEQPVIKAEDKLKTILESASLVFEKHIKKKDKLVTLQDPKWFEKRTWAVSEEQLERWREKLKNDKLTLDDFVEMACLTGKQIHETLANDETLSSLSWDVDYSRWMLQLYATLSPRQKAALTTPMGLPVMMLTREQWPYFEVLLNHGEVGANEYINELLSERESLVFTMVMGDDGAICTFNLEDRSVQPDPETGVVYTHVGNWSINLRPDDPYEYDEYDYPEDGYEYYEEYDYSAEDGYYEDPGLSEDYIEPDVYDYSE